MLLYHNAKYYIINQFPSKITIHLFTQSYNFNMLCSKLKIKTNLKDLRSTPA